MVEFMLTSMFENTDFGVWPLGWILSLGIGLPLFAVMAWFLRRRTQGSASWRFLVCFVLATAITPSFFPFSIGHGAMFFIVPAVLPVVGMF